MSYSVFEGRDHAARNESPFVLGFIEAMFFTECGHVAASEWLNVDPDERTIDGELPADVGYIDLSPESLAAIRADCETWQAANAELLARAYDAHWKAAAMAEGWTRVAHNGLFNGPVGSDTRLADYESWEDLCECEGIEPGAAYDEVQAGRDYWFTRNGHGVGFWERECLTDMSDIGDRLAKACENKPVRVWYDAPFVHVEFD